MCIPAGRKARRSESPPILEASTQHFSPESIEVDHCSKHKKGHSTAPGGSDVPERLREESRHIPEETHLEGRRLTIPRKKHFSKNHDD